MKCSSALIWLSIVSGIAAQEIGDLCPIADDLKTRKNNNCNACFGKCVNESIEMRELLNYEHYNCVCEESLANEKEIGDPCPTDETSDCETCFKSCVITSFVSLAVEGAISQPVCGCRRDKKRGDLCPIDGDIPVTKECDACADNCIIDGIMQNKMKGSRPMRYHCKCGDGETAGASPAPKLRCHILKI